MWTCPKCGREFKRRNQGHYCGKAPENVDEYISLQEEKAQNHLNLLRKTILECIQDVNEKIALSMPTYTKNGYSISFSTCKNHISCKCQYKNDQKVENKNVHLPRAIPQPVLP